MKKVEEYRHRASDCRNLSQNGPLELRAHYVGLADMWERLAEERLTFFVVDPMIGTAKNPG